MEISIVNRRLARNLNDRKAMVKAFGAECAKKLAIRLTELQAAQSLHDLAPPYSKPARCHELSENRKGQLTVDLKHPYRLVFEPNHDPLPLKDDGGLDWKGVTDICIVDVEDTHG